MGSRSALVLLLVVVLPGALPANILAVFPHSGRSHHLVFEPLLLGLAARGHRLTVLSHFPAAHKAPRHAGFRDVDLRGSTPSLDSVLPLPVLQGLNPFTDFLAITRIGQESCDGVLSVPGVRALLASNETFDLIVDEAFNTDCFLGFAHRFRPAPVVSLSSSVLMPWSGGRVGNPLSPGLRPNLFLWLTDSMSLWERVLNTLFTALVNSVKALHWDRLAQRVAERHFGPGVPPLRLLAKNTSLVLVNSHHSVNLPLPAVPAVVEVGGLHIPDYVQPLPKVRPEAFLNRIGGRGRGGVEQRVGVRRGFGRKPSVEGMGCPKPSPARGGGDASRLLRYAPCYDTRGVAARGGGTDWTTPRRATPRHATPRRYLRVSSSSHGRVALSIIGGQSLSAEPSPAVTSRQRRQLPAAAPRHARCQLAPRMWCSPPPPCTGRTKA
jgi:hypothetical protein